MLRCSDRLAPTNQPYFCQILRANLKILYISVNEFGSAYFQRGCTSEDVCKERDDTEIEFCITCKSKFCNYDVMVLDQEVEDYLNEVRNYYFSLESVEKSHTAANEENLKKMNDSPSGIVSVLQEVLSKSSTNSEQNLNKLADDDLNDNFNNFGKRVSSADLAFGDEDTASAHNEDIEFRDNDFDEIEHYDFDVRMDRPKHLVKRN